jgi:hypothetical protein
MNEVGHDCITPKRSAILCCVLPSPENATVTVHSSGEKFLECR